MARLRPLSTLIMRAGTSLLAFSLRGLSSLTSALQARHTGVRLGTLAPRKTHLGRTLETACNGGSGPECRQCKVHILGDEERAVLGRGIAVSGLIGLIAVSGSGGVVLGDHVPGLGDAGRGLAAYFAR